MMDVAIVLAVVVVVVGTGVAAWYALAIRRKFTEAEQLFHLTLASERHQVSMLRRMVRTLGGNLPHDPMYDRKLEDEEESPWDDRTV